MPIQKQIVREDCELVVTGRVDGPAAHELEVEVLGLNKSEVRQVFLNLAGANFLCSAALRVILQAHRQWHAKGKRFMISHTSPEVDQILDMTGMRELIVEPH